MQLRIINWISILITFSHQTWNRVLPLINTLNLSIKELLGKNPSTEILKDTGIGQTVRRLRKVKSHAVQSSSVSENFFSLANEQ